MNRRDFVAAMGGATAAASILNLKSVFAAGSTATPLFVKGLVMVSFEDPQVLRLGFPNAPGHKGTLTVIPQSGNSRSSNIKGRTTVTGAAVGTSQASRFVIPELVNMKEFYGDSVRSRISECPTVITIPYSTIQSIAAADLSPTPYTFIRRDTGVEVASFRVRKIAESIRINLAADAVIHMEREKSPMELKNAKEVHLEFGPENPAANSNVDPFAAHFGHYLTYLDRPANANFDVVPQKVGVTKAASARVGNSFAFFPPYTYCFLVEV